MFDSNPNALIRLKSDELTTWAEQSGLQKYRFNFPIGVSVLGRRHIYANDFSALHSLPISYKYLLASRLHPMINVTVINDPVSGDEPIGYRATTEYKNMEAFGIDFPIFIGVIMAILSSGHIVFYIKVIKIAI